MRTIAIFAEFAPWHRIAVVVQMLAFVVVEVVTGITDPKHCRLAAAEARAETAESQLQHVEKELVQSVELSRHYQMFCEERGYSRRLCLRLLVGTCFCLQCAGEGCDFVGVCMCV